MLVVTATVGASLDASVASIAVPATPDAASTSSPLPQAAATSDSAASKPSNFLNETFMIISKRGAHIENEYQYQGSR